ncbi:hypothetical protein NSERUTF1_5314 [Nocardia seriolae]|nr:hypothetical protein NSERUTF1_5314 [Nocardia seriolae]
MLRDPPVRTRTGYRMRGPRVSPGYICPVRTPPRKAHHHVDCR